MDEETTTPTPAPEGGEQPQPVEVPEPVVAAPEPSVEPESQETPEVQAEPSQDDELAKWAQAKGLTLDSENATKAAKMAREAEKAMHQKAQKASELEKSLSTASDEYAERVADDTGQDPELLKRLQRIEVRDAIGQFWSQDGLDRSYEPAMVKILAEKPHLAGDLDALYALAERKGGGVAAAKQQGSKEALKKLAHSQQAAVPRGNATTTAAPAKKDFSDLSVEEMEKRLGFVRR